MSHNPRAIATLGIGYGALAIATIGFLASQPVQPPDIPAGSGGAGFPSFGITPREHERFMAERRRREEEAIFIALLN